MPDIAMCKQWRCKLWMSCYRFRARPSAQQSYIDREPAERLDDGQYFCNDYWPVVRQIGPVRSLEQLSLAKAEGEFD